MKKHLQRYAFIYILALLFVTSWLGQGLTQWTEFVSEQKTHGEPAMLSEFWPQFWKSTFENWQSEFLQLLVQAMGMVVLAKHIFKRSTEDTERIESKIDEINRKLDYDDSDLW